jgi:hypothetical protein
MAVETVSKPFQQYAEGMEKSMLFRSCFSTVAWCRLPSAKSHVRLWSEN